MTVLKHRKDHIDTFVLNMQIMSANWLRLPNNANEANFQEATGVSIYIENGFNLCAKFEPRGYTLHTVVSRYATTIIEYPFNQVYANRAENNSRYRSTVMAQQVVELNAIYTTLYQFIGYLNQQPFDQGDPSISFDSFNNWFQP